MVWILLIVSLLIPLFSSLYMRVMFNKYREVRNTRGITGAEAARQLLLENHIADVTIEPVSGDLTDHYDPVSKTIRLSADVYHQDTVAAVGVAMHEAGHALQYAKGYAPARVRSAIVKTTNIASYASYFLIMLGLISSALRPLLTLGIWAFTIVIAFQVITLPVEFNASGRAVRALKSMNLLTGEEQKGVRRVLTAAALTYVAALLVSILQLIRLLMIRERR